jgi:16S rRNA processing protein RimM
VAPHGLRGEVRLRPETDFPDRFAALRRAYLIHDGRTARVRIGGARAHRGGLIVAIGGVEGRGGAEALRGAALAVPRADLAPLAEGSFYVFEVIGLRVRTEDGRMLGVVDEVMRGAAHDVYAVRDGARRVLVPAVSQIVRSIDRKRGEMVVSLPAGLEESPCASTS